MSRKTDSGLDAAPMPTDVPVSICRPRIVFFRRCVAPSSTVSRSRGLVREDVFKMDDPDPDLGSRAIDPSSASKSFFRLRGVCWPGMPDGGGGRGGIGCRSRPKELSSDSESLLRLRGVCWPGDPEGGGGSG